MPSPKVLPLPLLSVVLAMALAPSLVPAALAASWEPVTAEQLAQAKSTIEPGAGAEAIFQKVWVEDKLAGRSLRSTWEVYVRIKIFTDQAAQEYSKIDIDYPLHDVFIHGVEARTIQPDGSIVPLDPKAQVKEVVVKKKGEGVRRRSFAPPALKAGCIVEYRVHEVRYDAEAQVAAFDLQRDIPTQQISYYVKPLQLQGWFLRQMRFHTGAVPKEYPVDGYYETTVRDQLGFKAEPFSPPEYQQRAWMLEYYTDEKLTTPETFWKKYGRRVWDEIDIGTKPDKDVRAQAEQITSGAATDVERTRRLAEWVQREFKVCRSNDPDSLKAAGLHRNSGLKDALRQKGGTYLDADLTFAGLARALGLETRWLRVPSRRDWFFDQNMMNGYFLPAYEVGVRLNGKWEAFDPGSRYLPWDMVPWDEEAQLALLCDRDSSRFVETPVAEPGRSLVTRRGTLTLAEDGTVEGDLTLSFSGHLNEVMRSAFEDVSGSDQDSTLLEETNWKKAGVHVSQVELVRGSDERQPLEAKCHVKLPEFATVTGKRIIVEPAVLHARAGAPFTASVRRSPVYFPYAWSERDSILLNLPEGWKAAAVEAPEPVKAPGVAAYECRALVSEDGRRILYLRALHVGEGGSLYFPQGHYPGVKRLFDQILERDRATVTLTRLEAKP